MAKEIVDESGVTNIIVEVRQILLICLVRKKLTRSTVGTSVVLVRCCGGKIFPILESNIVD